MSNTKAADPPEPEVPPAELIEWEEWALITEEHYDAQQRWRNDPLGLPLGHRKRRGNTKKKKK